MRRVLISLLLAAPVLLSGCGPVAPPPAVAPPPPTPAPPSPPPAVDWRDAPLTPGSWSYGKQDMSSIATYGVANAPPGLGSVFTLSCLASSRQVSFSLRAGPETSVTFRTTFGDATAPVAPAGSPSRSRLVGQFAASDPVLDKLAYSRGRFVVEIGTAERLILPAWPEIARVIEDCRG